MIGDFEIVWEEPPARSTQAGILWRDILRSVQERPGEWAAVREMKDSKAASNAAYGLRVGALRPPEGAWEFVSRGRRIYARYLGERAA